MDQAVKQKQQCLSQFLRSQFHGKLTHLLLSVSVCSSLFFSYSYWLSLLHSFDFNFHDSLPFQLLDKNCMFLLCNGLLVFLVKNSGLIGSSSTYNDGCEDVPPADQSIYLQPKALLDNEASLKSTIDEEIENSVGIVEEEEEEEFREGNEILSREELNKRSDEFIAKMKQELRIEAGHDNN